MRCPAVMIELVYPSFTANAEVNRRVPGNQTAFDLQDLEDGVRYAVSVNALIGSNEGEPATVYIVTGVCMHTFSDVQVRLCF